MVGELFDLYLGYLKHLADDDGIPPEDLREHLRRVASIMKFLLFLATVSDE